MSPILTCLLCHHHCCLADGEIGFCRARQHQQGRLVSLSYGKLTSLALDPIEKKPLYHFHPGTHILSAGSFGCNLACPFCQNHEISQHGREATRFVLPPEKLAALAGKMHKETGSIGLAFTYNEPLINIEYVLDTFRLIKETGLATVLVTNGSLAPARFHDLLPLTDAMNIDLKCFTEKGCRSLSGNLAETKENIVQAVRFGPHVELTTLIVPGLNDRLLEMRDEAQWIASLSPEIPLHLTRYFPRYHACRPETSLSCLAALSREAKQYLTWVHLGNV